MLELIVNAKKEEKEIELIENGKLIEYYKENKVEERNEGNIYLGFIKDIVPGMQSAFVNIGKPKTGFIHLRDILPKVNLAKVDKEDIKQPKITEAIQPNQPILVQIKKDSNANKGAKVSTHINLPSKYVVFTPNTDIITISQKVEDKKEVERLEKLAKETLGKNNGVIIRTAAIGKTEEVINDIKKQEKKWNEIYSKYQKLLSNKISKPTLVYENEGIIEKLLIDLLSKDLKKISVNDKDDYTLIKKCISENQELKNIKVEVKDISQLELKYDLEKQKQRIENRKIWLNSGAFITIDKTEALTAIDVNTGKYTGNDNLEETVYKVNSEATTEIAKQLRLRDIGGIIIVDYIDMDNLKNKKKIEEQLKEELKKDRTKTQVEGFTKLDLMELTRKHICSHKE